MLFEVKQNLQTNCIFILSGMETGNEKLGDIFAISTNKYGAKLGEVFQNLMTEFGTI